MSRGLGSRSVGRLLPFDTRDMIILIDERRAAATYHSTSSFDMTSRSLIVTTYCRAKVIMRILTLLSTLRNVLLFQGFQQSMESDACMFQGFQTQI